MSQNLTDVERIHMQTQGHIPRLLFVLAGPSGVGKNTIIKKLLANHPHEMGRVITHTTREKREDETEGEQYHFVTNSQFTALARQGKLMEATADGTGHDVYKTGHWYSMPTDIYADIPPEKHLVFAEVDVPGTRLLRQHYPDSITIFVTATPQDLLARIDERDDDHMDDDDLAHRMITAYEQIQAAGEFDYLIVNKQDGLEETIRAIENIIQVERMRVRYDPDLEAIMPKKAFLPPFEHST